ncbi:DoxX family protein [Streptomyces sioyaensis]|uniref:DoxX family protein n=1 Tax=Streptomyces sioyaensis TaxID=67364 RepID=A0A4Q1QYL7_9ACTN|nr:DoxX family protein [Streptomyces sioyaensis]MBM4791838.1 DoxX family protein [Streptomyces sioyaensis]RXS68192.1 DoxX family protein [Streptomyces sioyaensis]
MNMVLWGLAGVLAVAFLAAGAMKLSQPKEKLVASGMGWAGDMSAGTVKLIGAMEVLAAVGLTVPALSGIAPVLVPLAALGLVLVMVGGVVVHARRSETQMIIVDVALLAFAAVVVWGRFGPYSF